MLLVLGFVQAGSDPTCKVDVVLSYLQGCCFVDAHPTSVCPDARDANMVWDDTDADRTNGLYRTYLAVDTPIVRVPL